MHEYVTRLSIARLLRQSVAEEIGLQNKRPGFDSWSDLGFLRGKVGFFL
jgi:hypothetical protein